jgi:hypothetical protein
MRQRRHHQRATAEWIPVGADRDPVGRSYALDQCPDVVVIGGQCDLRRLPRPRVCAPTA